MTYKVIVIGAGASGLMAAKLLAEKNHQVTLIEARDRTGGRIDTDQVKFSIPVEAGAEFMHGKQPLTLSLIQDSESKTSLLSGKRYQIWNGALHEGDFFDDSWEEFINALDQLKTDTDIASFLKKNFNQDEYNEFRKRVIGFVEGYDAADSHRVSALALRDEWSQSDDRQYRIQGGYSKPMHFLEEKIKQKGGIFLLSSPVTEIQWAQARVKVITENGAHVEGEKLIITVPVGVLKKNMIRFSPALPAHTTAFDQMGFGGVIKFFFEFRHSFWEHRASRPLKDLAFIFSDAEIPTWWSQLPDKTPLLTGWLGGPRTIDIDHDKESLYRKAIFSLQNIFNCSASEVMNEIDRWHIADWVQDPHSFGAYAYPTVQSKKARDFVSQPVQDTIYFAGEALYYGPAMGTVEAALMSGQEVAGKIK